MKSSTGVIALLLAIHVSATGQVPEDSLRAGITIVTPGRTAFVLVDSVASGHTPIRIDSLLPGRHVIRVQSLPLSQWGGSPIVDTVELGRGERRELAYAPSSPVRLSSSPSGARVLLRNALLGTTPMTLQLFGLQASDSLIFQAEGYEQAAVVGLDSVQGGIMVPLKKIWTPIEPNPGVEERVKNGDRPSFQLIGPIAGTVVAGTIAAFCKIHADDINNQYLATGDPALLSETRRYDLISAIALVVTEAGMALLTYVLLSP